MMRERSANFFIVCDLFGFKHAPHDSMLQAAHGQKRGKEAWEQANCPHKERKLVHGRDQLLRAKQVFDLLRARLDRKVCDWLQRTLRPHTSLDWFVYLWFEL